MISFVVGRGMGHQGRCISIVLKLLELQRKVNVFSFKETERYLNQNLPKCNRIFLYESSGLKNKEWIRKYGGLFHRSNLIVHDWRPEIIKFKEKQLISPKTPLVSLYHSDFIKHPTDSQEMRKFKKHILSVASQTDAFIHMNIVSPVKMPDIDTLYFPVPLIAREVTEKSAQVKKRLGLDKNERFILVHMGSGLGMHRYQHIDKWYNELNNFKSDYRLVVAGQLTDEHYDFRRGIIQAPIFPNGKNLVNAADLVISKPGMGILSDCISLQKPLLFLPADNMEREQKVNMLADIMESDLALLSDYRHLHHKIKEAIREKNVYKSKFSHIPTNGAEVVSKILRKMEKYPRKDLPDQYKKLLHLTPFGR